MGDRTERQFRLVRPRVLRDADAKEVIDALTAIFVEHVHGDQASQRHAAHHADEPHRHAGQQQQASPAGKEYDRLAEVRLLHKDRRDQQRQHAGQRNDRQGHVLAPQ